MGGGGSLVPVASIDEGRVGRLELVVRREGALKRLYTVVRPVGAQAAPELVRRAQAALRVTHTNVVRPIDLGEDAEGPFLWLSYAEGMTVAELVGSSAGPAQQPPVPMQIAVRIATQIAEGAMAARALAPVIAPRWIVLGFDGIVQLSGLAVGAAEAGYSAPEVLRGEPPDEGSELFALGVCLWELLAGRRLYPVDDGSSARRIASEPTPDVGLEREEVPVSAVKLLFELLAKDPSRRPSGLTEVAERLAEVTRQLASEEGPVEIAPWLEDRFGAERDRRRRAIADAVVPLERTGL